jgi:hypothetical protein
MNEFQIIIDIIILLSSLCTCILFFILIKSKILLFSSIDVAYTVNFYGYKQCNFFGSYQDVRYEDFFIINKKDRKIYIKRIDFIFKNKSRKTIYCSESFIELNPYESKKYRMIRQDWI